MICNKTSVSLENDVFISRFIQENMAHNLLKSQINSLDFMIKTVQVKKVLV